MKTSKTVQPALDIASAILTVRGEKVLLDSDLARIYGVQTKVFNQAVRRNLAKFPEDFRFQLTRKEEDEVLRLRSQFVTLKPGRGQHRKYLPRVFTEHGAIMAANVLNSPRAVQKSVFVVRVFVKMRELLGGTKELARQLRELEAKLTARLDGHEAAIVDVLQRVMRLLDPPPAPEPPRRQIGFHVKPESGMESKAKAKKK
jgi:hypothetical protein